jgi:prepilin-type N-terminal cleavage/methylation domain-containing protein
MYAWFRKNLDRKERGFTLIELVVVLAIIAILIAAAVPLYLGARKKAYKAEADNALQELKTLEWAYYQQNSSFTSNTDPNLGFFAPSGSHWTFTATPNGSTAVTMVAQGTSAPLTSTDQITLILNSNGSTTSSSTF